MESNKVQLIEAADTTAVSENDVELRTEGATALAPEEQITREQRRSRRKRAVRARTISARFAVPIW